MASLKNSPGEYCLEQQAFSNQQQYLHYKNSRVPQVNKLPGLGIKWDWEAITSKIESGSHFNISAP